VFMDELQHITAAILAGGAGTRLRAVIADRPKVLAEVGGRRFITYLLDQLSTQGVRRVVLLTGYMGNQVRDCLGERHGDLDLLYSREDRPLGTAGAIVQALPLLSSQTVLVLNGDSYCETDFQESLAWHSEKGAKATLVLTHLENVARYGQVTVGERGRIEEFCEKRATAEAGWINSGVYWFERAVLAALPRQEPLSLETQVLPSWIGKGLYGYFGRGGFLDIGVPEDYARAGEFFPHFAATTT
jgi:D-glycero-alpha-D-manno-heptose 1-phosphate guanylyltransferase